MLRSSTMLQLYRLKIVKRKIEIPPSVTSPWVIQKYASRYLHKLGFCRNKKKFTHFNQIKGAFLGNKFDSFWTYVFKNLKSCGDWTFFNKQNFNFFDMHVFFKNLNVFENSVAHFPNLFRNLYIVLKITTIFLT